MAVISLFLFCFTESKAETRTAFCAGVMDAVWISSFGMTHFQDDPFKHLLMRSVSRPAPIASTAQAGFFLRNADLNDDPVEGFHDLCYFLGEAKER